MSNAYPTSQGTETLKKSHFEPTAHIPSLTQCSPAHIPLLSPPQLFLSPSVKQEEGSPASDLMQSHCKSSISKIPKNTEGFLERKYYHRLEESVRLSNRFSLWNYVAYFLCMVVNQIIENNADTLQIVYFISMGLSILGFQAAFFSKINIPIVFLFFIVGVMHSLVFAWQPLFLQLKSGSQFERILAQYQLLSLLLSGLHWKSSSYIVLLASLFQTIQQYQHPLRIIFAWLLGFIHLVTSFQGQKFDRQKFKTKTHKTQSLKQITEILNAKLPCGVVIFQRKKHPNSVIQRQSSKIFADELPVRKQTIDFIKNRKKTISKQFFNIPSNIACASPVNTQPQKQSHFFVSQELDDLEIRFINSTFFALMEQSTTPTLNPPSIHQQDYTLNSSPVKRKQSYLRLRDTETLSNVNNFLESIQVPHEQKNRTQKRFLSQNIQNQQEPKDIKSKTDCLVLQPCSPKQEQNSNESIGFYTNLKNCALASNQHASNQEDSLSFKRLVMNFFSCTDSNNENKHKEIDTVFFNCQSQLTKKTTDDKNGGDQQRQFDIKVASSGLFGEEELILMVSDSTDRFMMKQMKESSEFKSQLLNYIQHIAKTPLNSIIQLSETMEQWFPFQEAGKQLSEDIQNNIEIIKKNGLLLHHQVQSIIDLQQINSDSRISLKTDLIDLFQVVQEVKELFKIEIVSKNLFFNINIDQGSSIEMQTDENRLIQILIEIIGNSIKFTRQNDSITITLNQHRTYAVNLISITIVDTGTGMSDEQVANINSSVVVENPLIQKGHFREGPGIGLEVSRKLIGLLGPFSKFNLKSSKNQGSSFRFWLYSNLNEKESVEKSSQTMRKTSDMIFEPSEMKSFEKFIISNKLQHMEIMVDPYSLVHSGGGTTSNKESNHMQLYTRRSSKLSFSPITSPRAPKFSENTNSNSVGFSVPNTGFINPSTIFNSPFGGTMLLHSYHSNSPLKMRKRDLTITSFLQEARRKPLLEYIQQIGDIQTGSSQINCTNVSLSSEVTENFIKPQAVNIKFLRNLSRQDSWCYQARKCNLSSLKDGSQSNLLPFKNNHGNMQSKLLSKSPHSLIPDQFSANELNPRDSQNIDEISVNQIEDESSYQGLRKGQKVKSIIENSFENCWSSISEDVCKVAKFPRQLETQSNYQLFRKSENRLKPKIVSKCDIKHESETQLDQEVEMIPNKEENMKSSEKKDSFTEKKQFTFNSFRFSLLSELERNSMCTSSSNDENKTSRFTAMLNCQSKSPSQFISSKGSSSLSLLKKQSQDSGNPYEGANQRVVSLQKSLFKLAIEDQTDRGFAFQQQQQQQPSSAYQQEFEAATFRIPEGEGLSEESAEQSSSDNKSEESSKIDIELQQNNEEIPQKQEQKHYQKIPPQSNTIMSLQNIGRDECQTNNISNNSKISDQHQKKLHEITFTNEKTQLKNGPLWNQGSTIRSQDINQDVFDALFSTETLLLIVDDTAFNRIVLKQMFKSSSNLQIDEATNGEHALQRIKELKESRGMTYSMIFMDLNMPVMDGFEAFKNIQNLIHTNYIKWVPVVAVTAYDTEVEHCRNIGFDGFISKPIRVKEMVRTLLRIIQLNSNHTEEHY